MTDVLQTAKMRADLYGVKDVLVATASRGATAKRALRVFGDGYRIYAVGNPPSSHENSLCLHAGISEEKRRELEQLGIIVARYPCSIGQGEAWHAGGKVYDLPAYRLPGATTLDTLMETIDAGKKEVLRAIVMRAFQWFGEGGRVCLEIALMAADAGAIAPHTRAVAIATPVDLGVPHVAMIVDVTTSSDLFSGRFGIVDVAQVPQYTPLVVADLGRSLRFYRDVLGLEVISGSEKEVYAEFALGAGSLALVEPASLHLVRQRTSLAVTPASRGERRLLFEVGDVQAVKDRLTAAGVPFGPGDQPWITAFNDPDDHDLCIMPR